MKTIRVNGKGQIKVHPDMTRVVIELEGTYKDYAETLRRSSEDTEAIKDLLEPFGFKRTDLKTLSFDVDIWTSVEELYFFTKWGNFTPLSAG